MNDLSARGLLEIVTTHVQANELAAIPDAKRERGEALANVYARLTKTVVPTAAMIWDVSEWDGGMRPEYGHPTIEDILRTNTADAEDALIALTAETHADILVTNEKTLPKRIAGRVFALEVLPFDGSSNA